MFHVVKQVSIILDQHSTKMKMKESLNSIKLTVKFKVANVLVFLTTVKLQNIEQ
jgi:hypothetical protein